MNPSSTTPGSGRLTAGDIGIAKLRKGVEFCSFCISVFFSTVFRGNPDKVWDFMKHNGWTEAQLKKNHFTSGEREALVQKRKAFCDMDITLQIHIIKVIWNMSDETADRLNEIKDIRNEISHEIKALEEEMKDTKKFEHRFNQVRDLAVGLLETLKPYPSLPLTHADIDLKKQEIEDRFTELQKQDVVVDVGMAKDILKELMQNNDSLEVLRHLHCFANITGMGSFKLEDVYTALGLQREERGLHPQDTRVVPMKLEEVLATTMPGGKMPHLICLEGPAGAGKSTLLAHVASERWAGSTGIMGLGSFDLVLHFVCKDAMCINLTELVKLSLRPSDIPNELLLRATRELKVLILADGFDEVSNKGRDLLKDVLNESKHGHGSLQVLLTTRTGSLSQALNFVHGIENLCITVLPVAENDKETMTKKYYSVLAAKMTSPPPEDELVKNVVVAATYMGKTPFVIFLLTYLALVEPDKVRAPMTLSQLYGLLDAINLGHLERRLESKGLTYQQIKSQISLFTRLLNKEALKTLLEGEAKIDQDRLQRLTSNCDHPKEMLDAHMSSRSERTLTGDEVVYEFPHTSHLEHRAALAVLDTLLEDPAACLKEVLGLQGLQVQDMMNLLFRLENLLSILPGVFKSKNLFFRYAKYAYELVELLITAFKKNGDVALNAIGQTSGDVMLTKAFLSTMSEEWMISKHFHVLKELQEYPKRISIVLIRCSNEEPHLEEAIKLVCQRCAGASLHQAPCWECEGGCCTWPIATLVHEAYKLEVVRRGFQVGEVTVPWGKDASIPPSFRKITARFVSMESLTRFVSSFNDLPDLSFGQLDVHVSAPGLRGHPWSVPLPPLQPSCDDRGHCEVSLEHLEDGDLDWATDLLSSLGRVIRGSEDGQYYRQYYWISFPESSMSPAGLKKLLRGLAHRRVRTVLAADLAPSLSSWEAHWVQEEERKQFTRTEGGFGIDFIEPSAYCPAPVVGPRRLVAEAEGLPRLLNPGHPGIVLTLAPPLPVSIPLTTEVELYSSSREWESVDLHYETTDGRLLLDVRYCNFLGVAQVEVKTRGGVQRSSDPLPATALIMPRVSILEHADQWEVRLDTGEGSRSTGIRSGLPKEEAELRGLGRRVQVQVPQVNKYVSSMSLLSLRTWEEL